MQHGAHGEKQVPTQPSPRANTRFAFRSCQVVPGNSSAWEHMQRAQVQRKPMGRRQTVCHRRFFSVPASEAKSHTSCQDWSPDRSRRPGANGGGRPGRGHGSDMTLVSGPCLPYTASVVHHGAAWEADLDSKTPTTWYAAPGDVHTQERLPSGRSGSDAQFSRTMLKSSHTNGSPYLEEKTSH